MKKFLSFALALFMLLAIIPFSALMMDASAVVNYGANIALGKSYTVTRTNKGVISAYHPIKLNASLTDGVVKRQIGQTEINNNSWFGFQTYYNTIPTSGDFGKVGEVVIDLKENYGLKKVRVHAYSSFDGFILSTGMEFESTIEEVSVYTSNDGKNFVFQDSYYNGYYNFFDWMEFDIPNVNARYVKVAVKLYCNNGDVAYGCLNEIEVYGDKKADAYTERDLADTADITIVDSNNNPLKSARGYTNPLNDGIHNVPVEYVRNPNTRVNNWNNGGWNGLFKNSATTDQNCPDGVGYVVCDLKYLSQVNKVYIFGSNDSATKPNNITVQYSVDGINYSNEIPTKMRVCWTYGDWYEADISAEARYVRFKIKVANYWALFNEVTIYGHYGPQYELDFNTSSEGTLGGGMFEEFNPSEDYGGTWS